MAGARAVYWRRSIGARVVRGCGVSGVMRNIRNEFGVAPHQPVLTCIARYDRQKGIETLIDAMPALVVLFPELVVFIVGTGLEAARQVYVAQAVNLRVMSHLHLVGAQRDVKPYLEACDVYVQPSLYEGMGIALVEAMAMGKPCVATDCTAIPEVVADGVSGLLVPPGCPLSLAVRIAQLVIDAPLRARMGAAGRRIACERFDVTKTVPQLEAVYRDVSGQLPSRLSMLWRWPAAFGLMALWVVLCVGAGLYEWGGRVIRSVRGLRQSREARA